MARPSRVLRPQYLMRLMWSARLTCLSIQLEVYAPQLLIEFLSVPPFSGEFANHWYGLREACCLREASPLLPGVEFYCYLCAEGHQTCDYIQADCMKSILSCIDLRLQDVVGSCHTNLFQWVAPSQLISIPYFILKFLPPFVGSVCN